MNKVILIGRLTRDPELKYSSGSQMAILRTSVAVNRPVKDGESKADFPTVVMFGRTAENVEKFMKKGSQIAVEGRIQTGSYKNKQGDTVYTTEVIAERVEFIGTKSDSSASGSRGNAAPQMNAGIPDSFEEIDDDVPF